MSWLSPFVLSVMDMHSFVLFFFKCAHALSELKDLFSLVTITTMKLKLKTHQRILSYLEKVSDSSNSTKTADERYGYNLSKILCVTRRLCPELIPTVATVL